MEIEKITPNNTPYNTFGVCGMCKIEKSLDEFFQAPKDGAVSWNGTSEFCKQYHAEGKIVHGYGWHGDRYTIPETTNLSF